MDAASPASSAAAVSAAHARGTSSGRRADRRGGSYPAQQLHEDGHEDVMQRPTWTLRYLRAGDAGHSARDFGADATQCRSSRLCGRRRTCVSHGALRPHNSLSETSCRPSSSAFRPVRIRRTPRADADPPPPRSFSSAPTQRASRRFRALDKRPAAVVRRRSEALDGQPLGPSRSDKRVRGSPLLLPDVASRVPPPRG